MTCVLRHQSSSSINTLHVWLSSAEVDAIIVIQPEYSCFNQQRKIAHPYSLELEGPQMSLHDVPFPQVRLVLVTLPPMQHCTEMVRVELETASVKSFAQSSPT